ncbi:MAG: alpha/beta hydrolase [Chloroflexi bacterium]|jgi:esterase|nr:alpha/beta hydrolase [Chloroflexota bacterium]MBT4515450.1 alpha/beta hydrolase [Chloroflexota bacterium]MBT6681228.1 alpha/beta hydrolase [Chloroflexota bacterium]
MAFAAVPVSEVDSHRTTVTTNGLKYSVLEYGSPDNPPAILLHGVWSTGAVWHDISVALSETHHVRSVDFRGRSQTEWSSEGDYSTEAYVADVLGLYEAWGLDSATVIGHSMGGGVATALAAGHPEMIDSLVIIDSGPVMRAGSAVEFERQLASLAQDFPSMAAARAWQHHALPNISDDAVERRLDARLVEQDGRVVWREDPRIRTSLGLIVRPSEDEMWKRFLSVKARTLFVLGGNSQLVTDEAEKRLTTEMSDAKSVRIANAGHNVFEDNHDDTMIAINGFLPG